MLDRLLRVSITVNNELYVFTDYAITVQGSKYGSPTQNETVIKICNLPKKIRDFITTEASPRTRVKNKNRQKILIEAGRTEIGYSEVFSGDIVSATAGQPPDIWTTFRAITGYFNKTQYVTTQSPQNTTLKKISQDIAGGMDLLLDFTIEDRVIENYGYSGSKSRQIDKLAQLSESEVFIDDERLVVKPIAKPSTGNTFEMSVENGMIGVPEITDFGVKIDAYYDGRVKVGNEMILASKINPAADGRYVVYKADYNLTNRDKPFNMTIEARARA